MRDCDASGFVEVRAEDVDVVVPVLWDAGLFLGGGRGRIVQLPLASQIHSSSSSSDAVVTSDDVC